MVRDLHDDKVAEWAYIKHSRGYIVTAVVSIKDDVVYSELVGTRPIIGKGNTLTDAMNNATNQLPRGWMLAITPQGNCE
jgi:hypothetical protein